MEDAQRDVAKGWEFFSNANSSEMPLVTSDALSEVIDIIFSPGFYALISSCRRRSRGKLVCVVGEQRKTSTPPPISNCYLSNVQ